jgi:hypothetical protein
MGKGTYLSDWATMLGGSFRGRGIYLQRTTEEPGQTITKLSHHAFRLYPRHPRVSEFIRGVQFVRLSGQPEPQLPTADYADHAKDAEEHHK